MWVCVCVAVGAGGGFAWALAATPVYTATAPLYVSVPVQDNHDAESLVNSAVYARYAVVSYAQAAVAPAVLAAAAAELGQGLNVNSLAGRVSAASAEDTSVLNITATDPDPARAAAMANAVAEAFTQLATSSLDAPGADGASAVSIKALGPAQPPPAPDGPSRWRPVPLGAAVGLVLGIALAVALATPRQPASPTPNPPRDPSPAPT